MFALQVSFVELLVCVQFAAIAYLVLKLQKVRRVAESNQVDQRDHEAQTRITQYNRALDEMPRLVESSDDGWSEVQAAPKPRARSKRDKAPSGHIILYRKIGSQIFHSKFRCCTTAKDSRDVEITLACKTCMKGCYDDDAGR